MCGLGVFAFGFDVLDLCVCVFFVCFFGGCCVHISNYPDEKTETVQKETD